MWTSKRLSLFLYKNPLNFYIYVLQFGKRAVERELLSRVCFLNLFILMLILTRNRSFSPSTSKKRKNSVIVISSDSSDG